MRRPKWAENMTADDWAHLVKVYWHKRVPTLKDLRDDVRISLCLGLNHLQTVTILLSLPHIPGRKHWEGTNR